MAATKGKAPCRGAAKAQPPATAATSAALARDPRFETPNKWHDRWLEFCVHAVPETKSNARDGHWGATHKKNQEQAAAMTLAWHSAGRPAPARFPCVVRMTIIRETPQKDDDDNLGHRLKAMRDALCALLGHDDGSGQIIFEPPEQAKARDVRAHVRVQIRCMFAPSV